MDWLRLFTPSAWVQVGETVTEYDDHINELLDSGVKPIIKNKWLAKLGHLTIWIGNYPWAYGELYGTGMLPKMRTRKRLRSEVTKAMLQK